MYEENKTNLSIKRIEENDQTILNIKSIKQEHIFAVGDEEGKNRRGQNQSVYHHLIIATKLTIWSNRCFLV